MNNELPQMKYPEQKGLVSIIVPIYNNEVSLRECLDSILAQTFKNWEAILVNDGSTDNTGKIIDEYAQKDSRFIAVHKQNQGTLLARKAGLENSKGEFIATIDHDDTYNPQFLEKMYAKIMEINADFVWCKCQITNKKSAFNPTDRKWSVDTSQNVAISLINPIGPVWNKLIRREIYAKIRFPIMNIVWGEDRIQNCQIVYYSKLATLVPENLYFHRAGGFAGINEFPKQLIFEPLLAIAMHNILEKLFNGVIPCNVKKSFFYHCSLAAYCYFLMDEKEKQEVKNELEPLLENLIKAERKLNLKICLFLANKGIEFPFKFREIIKAKFLDRNKKG